MLSLYASDHQETEGSGQLARFLSPPSKIWMFFFSTFLFIQLRPHLCWSVTSRTPIELQSTISGCFSRLWYIHVDLTRYFSMCMSCTYRLCLTTIITYITHMSSPNHPSKLKAETSKYPYSILAAVSNAHRLTKCNYGIFQSPRFTTTKLR